MISLNVLPLGAAGAPGYGRAFADRDISFARYR